MNKFIQKLLPDGLRERSIRYAAEKAAEKKRETDPAQRCPESDKLPTAVVVPTPKLSIIEQGQLEYKELQKKQLMASYQAKKDADLEKRLKFIYIETLPLTPAPVRQTTGNKDPHISDFKLSDVRPIRLFFESASHHFLKYHSFPTTIFLSSEIAPELNDDFCIWFNQPFNHECWYPLGHNKTVDIAILFEDDLPGYIRKQIKSIPKDAAICMELPRA